MLTHTRTFAFRLNCKLILQTIFSYWITKEK